MEQKKNYTLPIVMMFLLFAMISFVTGLSNPLGVIVKNQFAVANWMSQLGNFANFIAYAVMGIPAGMMLKRIGYKKTALAAVAVGFVGVGIQYLSGIAGSFPVYLIGAFVSGFSMCMLNTVVNPMLNTLGGGVIGGKVSSKAQLTAVSVVALVFVLLGIFAPIDTMGRMPVFTGTGFAMIEVPIGVMFLTLCGLCTSVMWGGLFNLAVEGLGKYTSMGSGIFMVMVCGGGILPLIQGYVADISNYLSSYWVIIAGLAYMLFYALVGSKNVNKDIPVED